MPLLHVWPDRAFYMTACPFIIIAHDVRAKDTVFPPLGAHAEEVQKARK